MEKLLFLVKNRKNFLRFLKERLLFTKKRV